MRHHRAARPGCRALAVSGDVLRVSGKVLDAIFPDEALGQRHEARAVRGGARDEVRRARQRVPLVDTHTEVDRCDPQEAHVYKCLRLQ